MPTRVVHYIDPAMQADLTRYGLNPAEVFRQQQRNTELYLRWKTRQAEIKERDLKFRRFWLSFGAVIALAFLTGLAVGGWMLWQALAAVGLAALTIPLILAAGVLAAFGGHRCITIVQHMH
jgi:hypothetical protein